jgi:hypothetical protein
MLIIEHNQVETDAGAAFGARLCGAIRLGN